MTGGDTRGGEKAPRYFRTIQALRGVAALLVVIYHMVDAERIYGVGPAWLDGFARLGFAGVDVFFVISGFVMVTIAGSLNGSLAVAVSFLGRRAARILPMYWIFTSIVVGMMIVVPHSMDASFFAKSKLASYLLWPQDGYPLLQVGWTLSYEAFFYLVTTVVVAFAWTARFKAILAGWAVVVLALQWVSPAHPWQAVVASPLVWEFIAGGFVALYWPRLPASLALPVLVFGVLAFVAGAGILDELNRVQQYPLTRTLLFGMPAALVVLGLVRREAAGLAGAHPWARAIGDASYSLYLSHLFVITAMARLWARSGLNRSLTAHAAFIVAALGVATVFALLCYRLVERPLVRFLEGFIRGTPAMPGRRAIGTAATGSDVA